MQTVISEDKKMACVEVMRFLHQSTGIVSEEKLISHFIENKNKKRAEIEGIIDLLCSGEYLIKSRTQHSYLIDTVYYKYWDGVTYPEP